MARRIAHCRAWKPVAGISPVVLLVARVLPAVQLLPLNVTAQTPASCSQPAHSPYAGRVDILFFSLCCHTELAQARITAQRLKATLAQRTVCVETTAPTDAWAYFVHHPMLLMLPVSWIIFRFISCWLCTIVRMICFTKNYHCIRM